MPITNQMIPVSRFPDELDNNESLFEVFNMSESVLSKDFNITDLEISIVPREWNTTQLWSHYGGFLNIEGEIIYYKSVEFENHPNPPSSTNPQVTFFNDNNITEEEKNKYRRVTKFKNLIRYANSRNHVIGESIRGYVMSQHHNALKDALLGIETLIGIDNSFDHLSLDFRLRDLEELNVEQDDINCPYGTFWYEILSSDDFNKVVQFHISVIGDFDSFEFLPKENSTPITNDLNPIITYNNNEEISASLKVTRGDCCSCSSEGTILCEPCEFVPILDDIPILECPTIEPFEVPSFNCDCSVTIDCPECEICTTPTAVTFPSIPETIVLTGFPTEIIVSVPEITVPSITTAIDVNINVDFSGPRDDAGEGACFRLVPCGGTTS